MILNGTHSIFKKSCLATMVAMLSTPSAYALQQLSDDSLSEATGEGVALVLEDFKMVFQGPNDISGPSSYGNVPKYNELTLNQKLELGQKDTGFIRIIPTGENYDQKYNQYITPKMNEYSNQNYDSVYRSFYDPRHTTEREKIKATEYDALIAYEKTDGPDTYWRSRYLYHYNKTWAHEDDKDRESWSRRDATNNVNGLIHKPNIEDKVEDIIDRKAAQKVSPIATQLAKDKIRKDFATNLLPKLNAEFSSQKIKADIFIYGLALSKSDGTLNTRYSNVGFGWGTPDNPWLFRAGTAENVEQFEEQPTNVGYLALEAPLAYTPNDPNKLAGDIKLGFWSDIFSRSLNSSSEVNPFTGAPTSGLDKDFRLRTQFVANGLSLNGSQVRLFRTLGPDPSNIVDPKSLTNPTPKQISDFNNKESFQTLGIASIIRLNTNNDPSNLSINDKDLDSKGIRLSTATKNDLDSDVSTPAMKRGALAPIFNPDEGLYLYSPNINLVLGNMYQPFIVGSEGNNIILEVTRIPNIPSIYNQIYQNYGGGLGSADMKGSTCNVYACGDQITVGERNYQGRNATHSSIAIGTVGPKVSGQFITPLASGVGGRATVLEAKSTSGATGVVFKDSSGVQTNLGSALIDGLLIQHLKIKTTGL